MGTSHKEEHEIEIQLKENNQQTRPMKLQKQHPPPHIQQQQQQVKF